APVPFPRPLDEEIIANLAAAITPRTRIAVIDHITSSSALVIPLERMIEACHARGVPVLVDGAHGPGHVALDLAALNADWYAGNCHKWLNAPKGAGFLWARADRQQDLHPVIISHGYNKGFLAEFDGTGTRDHSARLSVPAAIDFHLALGGPALRARNAALAAEAAAMLAGRLGTETGTGNAPSGAMAMVRLPIARALAAADVQALRGRFLDAGTDVPLHPHNGAAWLRISAQAYNDMDDYERLAGIAQRICGSG
ncbi:MAG TPA: aminotransferase class V-fold PLP-dependent enzyme, partial [Acetobacteraceae bacterium]